MTLGETLLVESRSLDDVELVRQLNELTGRERETVVRVLARLSVMGERELERELGFPSLFVFCVRSLRYCEGTAFNRSKAAEACGRFPELLDMIEAGELSVAACAVLAPELTQANWRSLARQARGKSRRDVERLIASIQPAQAPPVRERVKFVAVAAGAEVPAPPRPLPAAQALQAQLPLPAPAPEARTEVYALRTVSLNEEAEHLLRRAKELLWHKYPEGRVEDILGEALRLLVQRLEPSKDAQPPRGPAQASRTRRIPNWVKAVVDRRDGDQCAFVGPDSRRCPERSGLEYDHIVPWALGGRSDDPSNIRRACFSHNQWRARKAFGRAGRAD